MKIQSAQCSMKGGRPYNEDTAFFTTTPSGFLAVVADGLGGCGGGETASRVAAEVLTEEFLAKPEITEENINVILQCANKAVLSHQTPGQEMKTTLAALLAHKDVYAAVHVGDSRIYHFRDGQLIFRTEDHSVPQMAMLAGEITEGQIRFHEDRNRVLRALGGDKRVKPNIRIWEGSTDRDAFLLCSDGFWEYVWETEMMADLAKSDTPQKWLDYMIGRLGKRYSEKNDNFSAVAVFTDGGFRNLFVKNCS